MPDLNTSSAEVQQNFSDFDVREDIITSLAEKGITAPFPIQAMTLPVALAGRDVIGQAKTGTGKTLGFGIPLLQNVVAPGENNPRNVPIGKPQGLIIVPTRELAIQVGKDLQDASTHRPVRIDVLYGGRSYEPQVESLKKGLEVVVGTPGRLIDLMRQKYLDLSYVRVAVLDEADEMLDLGFLEDIERIMQAVPSNRQTMLFSATMPSQIMALARRFMKQPTHIRSHDPEDSGDTKADIKQVVYRAHMLDKIEVLARILQAEGRGLSIVFTQTKREADRVASDLIQRGFAAAPLHGDLGQGAREQALRAFRNQKVDILVATDVAARGIDVDDVTHVINYQCPDDEKTYLHRTGRTGRAGKKGTAVTFVDWEDLARWSLIARTLGMESTEAVETYSTSPHLFSDLNIPEGTKGILPKDQQVRVGLNAEEIEDLGGRMNKRDNRGGRGGNRGGRNSDRGGRGCGDRNRNARGGRDSERKRDSEKREEREERAPRQRRERTRTKRFKAEGSENTAAPKAAKSESRDQATGSEQPRRNRNRRRTKNIRPASDSE